MGETKEGREYEEEKGMYNRKSVSSVRLENYGGLSVESTKWKSVVQFS